MVVGYPIIDGATLPAEDDLKGFLRIHRDIELPGKSVAGAERNDAQRGVAVDQRPGHLVYRTVTTGGEHITVVLPDSLTGDLGGMTGVAGDADHKIEFLLVESGCNHLRDVFL